jgi:hypothetical protein
MQTNETNTGFPSESSQITDQEKQVLAALQTGMQRKYKLKNKNIYQLKTLARRYPILTPAIRSELASRLAFGAAMREFNNFEIPDNLIN